MQDAARLDRYRQILISFADTHHDGAATDTDVDALAAAGLVWMKRLPVVDESIPETSVARRRPSRVRVEGGRMALGRVVVAHRIGGLTDRGREFVEVVRDEERWDEAKVQVMNAGRPPALEMLCQFLRV